MDSSGLTGGRIAHENLNVSEKRVLSTLLMGFKLYVYPLSVSVRIHMFLLRMKLCYGLVLNKIRLIKFKLLEKLIFPFSFIITIKFIFFTISKTYQNTPLPSNSLQP